MTTARVTYSDAQKKPVYIPNAINNKGYLVSGTKPYFNSAIMPADVLKRVKNFSGSTDIKKVIGTEFEPYLIKWGQNEGLFVEDNEEIKRRAENETLAKIENKELPIRLHSTTYFGLYAKEKMPTSVFMLIRHTGKYMSMQEMTDYLDDIDEFMIRPIGAGWYFSMEAKTILEKNGFEVILI